MEHPKKKKFIERLADESGVAIVVVDAKSREVAAANNNSICRVLTSSAEFNPRCAEFCGKAYAWATEAGEAVNYECHAGLECRAVPVKEQGQQFVAIVGRAFMKAENYRKATDRAINGDWRKFRPTEFFENVVMAGSTEKLVKTAARIESINGRIVEDILELDAPPVAAAKTAKKAAQPPAEQITELIERFNDEFEQTKQNREPSRRPESPSEVSAWRSLLGSLMSLEYKHACRTILDFVASRFSVDSLLWLERADGHLEPSISIGNLKDKPIKLGIAADNERLLEVAKGEEPLVFRERGAKKARTLNLFPVVVGTELRGAIAVEGVLEDSVKHSIARFSRSIGPQLEILRLRSEVSERDSLARAVARFNEGLKKIDAEDFWTHVTQISAELLRAERASLLIRNEKSDVLQTRAAIGARVNLFAEAGVGDRVARAVLDEGSPVVVSDIKSVGMQAAPRDWKYKTSSFISYPILIGERRLAVLNFTDRVGGDSFDEHDLDLLQAIAPQIAVAIDRTSLKDKAGEFEQLAVTDALTGLSNRRYLQRRLEEEILRSKRHRFPMSLLMLDVDEFKSYNDKFGHPAGDIALKIVASILSEILRGDDVAARYGGEEFSVLLPQTTSTEANAIAERIRQRVERTEFPKRKVTVSIGIASVSTEIDTPDDIIAAADHALYEAKNHGRNNVQIYDGFGNSLNEKIH